MPMASRSGKGRKRAGRKKQKVTPRRPGGPAPSEYTPARERFGRTYRGPFKVRGQKKKPVGWRGEPYAHDLARQGIETRPPAFAQVFRANAQTQEIGTHKTTVSTIDGWVTVIYHETPVVRWNPGTGEVILHSGGWRTLTTKNRMNQASNQFDLGYFVQQKDYDWFVHLPSGEVVEFQDGMKIRV